MGFPTDQDRGNLDSSQVHGEMRTTLPLTSLGLLSHDTVLTAALDNVEVPVGYAPAWAATLQVYNHYGPHLQLVVFLREVKAEMP